MVVGYTDTLKKSIKLVDSGARAGNKRSVKEVRCPVTTSIHAHVWDKQGIIITIVGTKEKVA